MIDLLASERQYLDHLAPIWFALPAAARGTVWVSGPLSNDPEPLARAGITAYRRGVPRGLSLVASYRDNRAARGPTVYVEHGAGQRYDLGGGRRDPSYAGSAEHENVVLFLCPRPEVADWWREVYPRVPAVAVGCPRLDAVAGAFHRVRQQDERGGQRTVAFSFHANARLVLETTTAFPAYESVLPRVVAGLRGSGVEVIGHGHPRLWPRLEPYWRGLDVEPVPEFADVVRRASVYCCDNSSTLPEAAAYGLSLVWMDAPYWRRDVRHGGRFWDWPAGQVECRAPDDLREAVDRALLDSAEARTARARMLYRVYGLLDGGAAERAAREVLRISSQYDQPGHTG